MFFDKLGKEIKRGWEEGWVDEIQLGFKIKTDDFLKLYHKYGKQKVEMKKIKKENK